MHVCMNLLSDISPLPFPSPPPPPPPLQASRGSVSYEPLSEGQLEEIRREVKQYVEGTLPELEVGWRGEEGEGGGRGEGGREGGAGEVRRNNEVIIIINYAISHTCIVI